MTREPTARRSAPWLLALACFWVVAAPAAEVKYFPIPGEDGAALPFSDSVRVGDLVFLAGKLGNLPGTRDLAPGGIAGETRQAMVNIRNSLARHGLSMADIVKCTVFLADIDEWAAMNEVYLTFFPGHRPARSALGVSGLALGARTEIECIAAIPD